MIRILETLSEKGEEAIFTPPNPSLQPGTEARKMPLTVLSSPVSYVSLSYGAYSTYNSLRLEPHWKHGYPRLDFLKL